MSAKGLMGKTSFIPEYINVHTVGFPLSIKFNLGLL